MRGNPPSTTLTQLLQIDFPSHPRSQLPFINFLGQENRTRGNLQHPSARYAPQPAKSCDIAHAHTSHVPPSRVSYVLYNAIRPCRAPQEEFFP